MISLDHEESNSYNEQKICYICKGKFCTDKVMKIILIENRLKFIAIIPENLDGLLIVSAV